MKTHRIVFLGSEGVGKTSLITRFVYGVFKEEHRNTLEDCYRHVALMPSGVYRQIDILDTGGDGEFTFMRELNIRLGTAFVVVYNVENLDSFQEAVCLCKLIHEIKGMQTSILMVGNKMDTKTRRVSTASALQVCQDDLNCQFMETSAKLNLNTKVVFDQVLPKPEDQCEKSPVVTCQMFAAYHRLFCKLFSKAFPKRASTTGCCDTRPEIATKKQWRL